MLLKVRIGTSFLNNGVFVFQLLALFVVANSCQKSSTLSFQHHSIANPLNGNAWGTGGFTLADYDLDGDLDVTVQRRSDSDRVFWYEYIEPDVWKPHFVGVGNEYQLGAASIDVNKDGYTDLVLGHVWFENPGNLKEKPDEEWQKHAYNGDMKHENHDIVAADVDLDGVDEIIMYNQEESTLRYYDIEDPYNWKYTDIATDVNKDDVHSGLFPNGVVDIDNDSFPDMIMPLYWHKNPGLKQGKWIPKEWPYKPILPNPYGLGIRVWAGDLNNDGLNDIIYSDCDVQFSKVFMLLNQGNGENWSETELQIPESNVGKTGSFHSLQVADFDNDGDFDVFAGEQEDPDELMKPKGLKERGFIFVNIGNARQPKFETLIIQTDNPGWHDALIGDVDNDGDIDIVSKVWNADEENYHLDYWENKLN